MTYVPPGAEDVVDIRRHFTSPLFDPWEEVLVPDFPIDTLPKVVASFVATYADLLGCDPAGLAMASLCALGAAIDHRCKLRIMRNGSWVASPRLWVLLSGDPSRKKTPAIDAATRELEEAQGEVYDAWEADVAVHRAAEGAEEDEPPKPPRYVISDTTTEKLGEILGRQARGILAKRDELAGWIGGMERYNGSGAADRAFWLQSYDGGRYTIDRVRRGETLVRNLSVSILGGIQPRRLAEMKDQTSDGLLQRFIPVMLKAARFPDDQPDGGAQDAYGRLVRKLLAIEPLTVVMTDEAMAEMERLRRHIFDVEQASGGLAAGFQAFAGKLPGMAASIALILHLARDYVHGPTSPVPIAIIKDVRRIVEDFILPHAFEFYRGAETATDGDRLKKLASYILTSRKERITASDLTSNVAAFRDIGLGEVNERVSPLIACGWLLPDDKGAIAKAWVVQPAVEKQFGERRKIEEERKTALANLMRAPRKGGVR